MRRCAGWNAADGATDGRDEWIALGLAERLHLLVLAAYDRMLAAGITPGGPAYRPAGSSVFTVYSQYPGASYGPVSLLGAG